MESMEANYSSLSVDEPDLGVQYKLTPRRAFMLSLDIIFFVVGFVGNGSVIFMTLRHKGLRSIPNLMIANLAVGDILVVILVIFTNVLYYLLESARAFLREYCQLFLFVQMLSQGVSVLTLTALSIDRYTIVMFPIRKQQNARKVTIMTVVGIWTISFVLVCPLFSLVDENTCWLSDAVSNTVYILFLVIFLYFMPAIVMVVCYCTTAHELLNRNAVLKLDPQGGQQQQRKRSRLAIIVLTMTIIFISSSSLMYIWIIVLRFAPSNPFVLNVHVNRAKTVLLKLNSIVNPIILYLMSSTYRLHLAHNLQICFGPFKKSKKPYYTIHTTSISRKTSLSSSFSMASRRISFMREMTTTPFSNASQQKELRKQNSCSFVGGVAPKARLAKEKSWPLSQRPSMKTENYIQRSQKKQIHISSSIASHQRGILKENHSSTGKKSTGEVLTPRIQEESHL